MRHSSRRILEATFAAALAANASTADEIVLRNGGRLSGVIVERSETRVTIETGPGRVTLPISRVERVVEGRSALAEFSERAAGLSPRDASGWAALARWAEDRDLLTQARVAWERVLAVDPGHPEANAGLGRVSLDGVWMSSDDAYRARGYVPYEGRWVTPAEHEAAVRERAAEHAAVLEARESDLRMREVEARTREAEARAHEAQTEAESGGIPLDYAYGYGYGYGGVVAAPYGYGPGYAPGYGTSQGHRSGPGYGPRRSGHRRPDGAGPDRPDRPSRPTHPDTRPARRPQTGPPRSHAGVQPPKGPEPTRRARR